MAQNPLSGHTAGTNDGLRDGDHILSPSLTNLYEGVHGNGILLPHDTAFGSGDRSNIANLPGAISAGTAANQVDVKPFEAILDGVLYDFGGVSDITLTFASGNADILMGTTASNLSTVTPQECLFVIIATSQGLKWTQTTIINTATGAYPSVSGTAAEYLKMDEVTKVDTSASKNRQTLVIGTVRGISTSAGSLTGCVVSLSEYNDKRVFVRPSPMYFSPVTSGAVSATTGITSHTALAQIHGTNEYGDFNSDTGWNGGVLWQSYNADGDSNLYYSAKDSQSFRHTHLLGPTGVKTTTADADMTFTFDDAQVFVLTPSTTIDLDPSGSFPPGHSVYVSNVSSANSIEFDDIGATATISFTGNPAENDTIAITDTAGLSRTYTAKSTATGSDLHFDRDGAVTAVADALEAAIIHANGHNGSITVTDNGSGNLTLTQATGGTAGNTIITSGLTNTTVTNFTDAGIKDTVSPLEACMFSYGNSGSQAVLTVTTGNADVTTDEADEITLISTDGTSKTYFVTDTNAGGVATNTVLVSGSDIGSTTAGGSNAGKIAVGIATTGGSKSTQNALLVELKAAIEHANGHNGKITVSAVPVAAGAAQSITLTQATGGTSGNRTITETIDDITKTDFIGSGWQRVMVSSSTPTPVSSGASGNVQRSDGSGGFTGSSNLNFDGSTLTVDTDFTGTTTATTKGTHIDFDATGITASGQTATNIGLDVDLNSDSPTMVGTVNNTGIDVDLTGGTSGAQTNVGIDVAVAGADTNYAALFSGGNVGIGTATPSSTLEVQGGLTTTGPVLTMSTKETSVVNNDVLGRINFQAPLDTGADSDLVAASIVAIAQDTFSDTVNSTALIFQTGKSEVATTKMTIDEDGAVTLASIAACGSDTDKFLVSDSGVIKFRTGAEVRSDIGAGTSSVTLSGSTDNTIATVTGANALAGEANLTFDGSTLAVTGALTTTTTATVGTDLTVTGGDVGFGNGQDATVSVAATTSTTAGRDLTISAGSSATGSANIDGGDLVLKSGGGDGTGTSIMTFNTKISGTDAAAERMRIHTNGYVGIGDASPDAPLHITRADDATALKIESVTDVTTHAPDIEIVKTGTPEAGNNMGAFEFWGKNETSDGADDGGTTMYARIYAGIDATAASTVQGTEAGTIGLQAEHQGTLRTMIFAQGDPSGGGMITMNYNSEDIDFRVCGDTNSNLLFANAGTDRVGIGLSFPMNKLQINHTGADGDDGMMIVRDDATTADGEILGGIGFDSDDGNTPSSITEASAFIASYATEDHTGTDKGGNLKFGVSLIDEDDDTTSTILANVGPPDTTANATCHAGLNSRATTAIVAAATYAPTVQDSGTLVIFNHANSNLTLPSVNNTTSVGVQFTVFNETGSTISAQIAVSNSATINGGAATALDDIESYKAATFVCSGNNTWIRIG